MIREAADSFVTRVQSGFVMGSFPKRHLQHERRRNPPTVLDRAAHAARVWEKGET